ncbi:lipoprotein [Kitasatospora xanthocidica]|uniref:L,D-transpeptidase n=1 Tax=Kitasatospora xanthocidica TaxID=83382 RepID=UPI00199C0986|nr:Ig-like domain-containing protein [Kitasatospora xanthocidica]GHF37427.1 lipoprotein [Kitasatospora xanthocidica]
MSTVQAARAAIRTDRFNRGAVALTMGGVLLMTAACGDGQDKGGDAAATAGATASSSAAPGGTGGTGGTEAATTPKTSVAVLNVEPKDGAQGVAPNALQVSVTKGKLTTVEVTDKNGKPVQGAISPDGSGWKPAAGLAPGTAYTVNAQATDADGLVAAATSAFTTVASGKQVSTNDNIADGQTYGVGMIVKVDFSSKIVNKEAVAKAITFEADNGTEVKGHWFGDNRLDFRPAEPWKPGTKVTIHYRLKGVEVAPGVWGDVDKDEPFTIGRSQVSTADAATHQLTIVRDGKSTTVPATLGDAQHASWGGTMVIMSKEKVTHMNSQTVGMGSEYDIPAAPHAMRLTTSGTYLHGNFWYKGDPFGKENTSHGCVALKDVEGGSDTSVAGSFYNSSLIGDIVTIVNSKEKTVAPDNGLGGWNLPWAKW